MTEIEQLALRAVACKGWQWHDGIRYFDSVHGKTFRLTAFDENSFFNFPLSVEQIPDLTDPATLGCLLAMVRDAYKDAQMYAACIGTEDNEWEVFDYCDVSIAGTHRGEAMALVAALEAAE